MNNQELEDEIKGLQEQINQIRAELARLTPLEVYGLIPDPITEPITDKQFEKVMKELKDHPGRVELEFPEEE